MIKHVTPTPPHPPKRGREHTELAAPTDSISPTAFARFRVDKQGFSKEEPSWVYPCMVRPTETLIVWPVM
jgi:hypothetical protein